jgi:hypothetical protein
MWCAVDAVVAGVAVECLLINPHLATYRSDFGLGRLTYGVEYYRMKSEMLLPMRWTDPWAIEHQVFTEATDVSFLSCIRHR